MRCVVCDDETAQSYSEAYGRAANETQAISTELLTTLFMLFPCTMQLLAAGSLITQRNYGTTDLLNYWLFSSTTTANFKLLFLVKGWFLCEKRSLGVSVVSTYEHLQFDRCTFESVKQVTLTKEGFTNTKARCCCCCCWSKCQWRVCAAI